MTLYFLHINERDESRACVKCDRITAGFHMLMFILFRKHLVAHVNTNCSVDIFIR